MKNVRRCEWARGEPAIRYHDEEWGVPVHDDRVFFEFLTLEGAQAGLSWDTILKKREHYRKVLAGFDARKVARFDKRRIERLLADPGIVRNRLKVESTVSNARAFLDLQAEEGSFDKWIWSFAGAPPPRTRARRLEDLPDRTELSDRLSKELKRRGFRFVGSTICYAFLQATGLVNDHTVGCFRRDEV
jgi:DNA-3-methyladenine glycosylase I